MVRAVPGRAVAVDRSGRRAAGAGRASPIASVVGPGAELDDRDAGGRMGHEHRQQPVPAVRGVARNRAQAGVRSVNPRSRPVRTSISVELHGRTAYGKIERIALRIRPMPPAAGADS